MKNRRRMRIFFAVVIAGVLLAAYAFFIEPYWIEVTRHTVSAPKAKLAAPLKIAHLSDLHTAGLGRREQSLLQQLQREQPDVIVISGDTIAAAADYAATRELLSRLQAPLGVWLVRGNWENWRPLSPQREREHYARAGVRLLLNSNAKLRTDVWIFGLDDPASGSTDLKAATAGIPRDGVTLALFHAPGYFNSAAGFADFAFAGHTHGGQIRIPGLGPLWLPRGSGRYVAGWYDSGASRLYVSRGVGTSVLPLRLACRPELAIITIQPQ